MAHHVEEGLIREGVIPRPPTVDSSSQLSRDELLKRVAELEAENQVRRLSLLARDVHLVRQD
jgi:hypothetical protein